MSIFLFLSVLFLVALLALLLVLHCADSLSWSKLRTLAEFAGWKTRRKSRLPTTR
jgi:hypothetical protein